MFVHLSSTGQLAATPPDTTGTWLHTLARTMAKAVGAGALTVASLGCVPGAQNTPGQGVRPFEPPAAATPVGATPVGATPVGATPVEVKAAGAKGAVNAAGTATAIFAGGCFWCIEKDFEKLAGVVEVESGYTAGNTPQPTYEQVSAGRTGHTEAVRVMYDPARVSYAELVEYFWRHIDPTVKDRQFCDVGSQYRSGIYWQNEAERKVAEDSRAALLKTGRFPTIHTELAPASTFWLAEAYHQDYYKKNPARYNYYRAGCGRDARVEQLWGKR